MELAYLHRPGHRMRVPVDATDHAVVLSPNGDAVMAMETNQPHAERFARLPWLTRMAGVEPCDDGSGDVWVTVVFNGVSSWSMEEEGAPRQLDFVLAWVRADGSLAAVTPTLRVVSKFTSATTSSPYGAVEMAADAAAADAVARRIVDTRILEGAPVLEVAPAVSSCYGTTASAAAGAAGGCGSGSGAGRIRIAMAARMRAAVAASASASASAAGEEEGGMGVGRKRARAPSRAASEAAEAEAGQDNDEEGACRPPTRASARLIGKSYDFAALASAGEEGSHAGDSGAAAAAGRGSVKRRALATSGGDAVVQVDRYGAAPSAIASPSSCPSRHQPPLPPQRGGLGGKMQHGAWSLETSQSTVEHERATAVAVAAPAFVSAGFVTPVVLLPGLTRGESSASATAVMSDPGWLDSFFEYVAAGGGLGGVDTSVDVDDGMRL